MKDPKKLYQEKTRQSKRQLTRQKFNETTPLCHINIVEDLTSKTSLFIFSDDYST